jgi:arylsulfatase A-like enzyme
MADADRPNILVIWGDDIGITNLSCYSDGLMGYRTPNIDRIAAEGMRFTDSYGEQSCTAGRASFITGQSVFRTGLSKVGIPGADTGLRAEDPTIAELLKPLGYATGQFGMNSWPDGAMTPFRSEKDTNWEGAFRVPEMIRWPGKIPPGVVSNEIVSHHDWLPTLLAAAGEPDIVEKLKAGHSIGDTTYRVHIDGFNLLPYLTGETGKSPRPGFVYFSDDGDLVAARYDNFKMVFMEQRASGTLQVWAEPFVTLRIPKLFNLRTDPFERADVTSNTYWDWFLDHAYLAIAAQGLIGDFLATFAEFPPRQKAASFTIDQALDKLEAVITAHR